MQEILITKANNGFILTFNDGVEIYASESKLVKRVRELLIDEKVEATVE